MGLARRVEPEWLDRLPAADPRARRSRRDLVRVNALMSNARIVAGALAAALPAGAVRIAEVGAGDGAFALRVARRLGAPFHGSHVALVDRQPAADAGTREAFARLGWQAEAVQADAFAWLREAPRRDALFANLFLHHFEDAALAGLLALAAARSDVFVACEPRRSGPALAASSLLALAGCGEVTRHDARVSVRAGFAGGELAALWPRAGWRIREGDRGLFSHAFVAVRS